MFYHPKYYKELRKRNKAARIPPTSSGQAASDQAISLRAHDGERERATGPGLKLEATSDKQQASSPKLRKFQATSSKRQAWSSKLQAGSYKLPDPRSREQKIISPLKKFRGPLTKGLDKDVSVVWMLYMEGNLMRRKSNFIPLGAL